MRALPLPSLSFLHSLPSPSRMPGLLQGVPFVLLCALTSLAQPIPADDWAKSYRGWHYYPSWVIPPSCIDPATCGAPPYVNRTGGFVDCFQVWSTSDPFADPPPSPRYVASYLFFDGIGYRSALATSDDLVHFEQPLAPEGILFSTRDITTPSDFDYGGAALIGPLMTDYNVTAPRVLARINASFWYAYFAQHTRDALEPPPGATGLARSTDARTWTRATPHPILDTNATRGAAAWEQVQVYAPFLVLGADGSVRDFYNAKGAFEQSGVASLPGGASALPGVDALGRSAWVRSPLNPVLRNDPAFDAHMASDPKVFYDAALGAWVMLYFGFGGDSHIPGASICIAFSRDGLSWTKASTPLYLPGGHPQGLDKCHAHKAWLNVDATGRKFLYYTGDDCHGRGILLLTSTPLAGVQ